MLGYIATQASNHQRDIRPDVTSKKFPVLASEQSNEQRNRAESDHPVKPGFSTVSAIHAVDPRWNTIRYKDNGQTKEENNWNS